MGKAKKAKVNDKSFSDNLPKNPMDDAFPEYEEEYAIPKWLAVGIMLLDECEGIELFIDNLPPRHYQNLFAHGFVTELRTEDLKYWYETTDKFAEFTKKTYPKLCDIVITKIRA